MPHSQRSRNGGIALHETPETQRRRTVQEAVEVLVKVFFWGCVSALSFLVSWL